MTWRPAVLLTVASALLAEVISGGTPLTLFVAPWVFLPYVVFVYGIPVLVLREVAVRRRYGPLGLWCLGVQYSLLNEGLFAQTLFHPLDVPVDAFAGYGLVTDVRVPFVVWIGVWHGLFSVLTPVLLVECLFPARAGLPWLPHRAIWPLVMVALAPAVANFLFVGEAGTRIAGHGAFIVVAGLALWLVAGRLPRTPRSATGAGAGWQPFAAGAALYLGASVVPEILAQGRVPAPLFLLYMAVVVAGAAWAVARRQRATRATGVVFVLGSVTAQAVLAVVFGLVIGDVQWALAGVLFTAVSVGMLTSIRRDRSAVPS